MPKKKGIDLLADFVPDKNNKNKNKIDHVLVVSGTLDRELIGRIVQKGVKNFLTKPFDEEAFKEKIKKMVT
jgi:response regulator of citrate/malate metabolism